MDNDQRTKNYERQRGKTTVADDGTVTVTPPRKLTSTQSRRIRHKAESRKTHIHAPDVLVDDKHKNVRVAHCETCRTPATVSA